MIEPQDTRQQAQRLITEAMDEIEERKKVRAEIQVSVGSGLTRDRVALIGLVLAVPVLIALVTINFAGESLKSWFAPKPAASVAREEAQNSLDALVFATPAACGSRKRG